MSSLEFRVSVELQAKRGPFLARAAKRIEDLILTSLVGGLGPVSVHVRSVGPVESASAGSKERAEAVEVALSSRAYPLGYLARPEQDNKSIVAAFHNVFGADSVIGREVTSRLL